jgi:hypothetical protein
MAVIFFMRTPDAVTLDAHNALSFLLPLNPGQLKLRKRRNMICMRIILQMKDIETS